MNRLKRNREIMKVAMVTGMYYEAYMNKGPRRVPIESGIEWVQRTLVDDKDCYNMFRMARPVFDELHDLLLKKYGLKSSPKMSSVEALGMFLWMVGAPQSFRQAENRLVRSTETISRKFDEVLACVVKLAADIISPRDPEFRTPHPRVQQRRFAPYFANCIGAIDGTHVPVVVPTKLVVQYMGRYGFTTQNVLAICDFDMRFTFVVTGWPGSVHDMRVFNAALSKYGDKFPHPPTGTSLLSIFFIHTCWNYICNCQQLNSLQASSI